jgi:hypothetical protein
MRYWSVALLQLLAFAQLSRCLATGKQGQQPEDDRSRFIGVWVLRVGDGKDRHVVRLRFRNKESGQIEVLRPDGANDTDGRCVVAGFAFRLGTDKEKAVLVIEDCLAFPDKGATIPYAWSEGKLKLEGGKVNSPGEVKEVELKGEWKREPQ